MAADTAKNLKMSLLTPDRVVKKDIEVLEVTIPGTAGELQVLPGHAPLITTLREGVLKFRETNAKTQSIVAISWGYAEISPAGVQILAGTVEIPEEIDIGRAERALKISRDRLVQAGLLASEDALKWQRKERRAQVRIETAKLAKPNNSTTLH